MSLCQARLSEIARIILTRSLCLWLSRGSYCCRHCYLYTHTHIDESYIVTSKIYLTIRSCLFCDRFSIKQQYTFSHFLDGTICVAYMYVYMNIWDRSLREEDDKDIIKYFNYNIRDFWASPDEPLDRKRSDSLQFCLQMTLFPLGRDCFFWLKYHKIN